MKQGNNRASAYEAKTHLSELLERVEAGEEITITKHDAPVAKLVPMKKERSAEERVARLSYGRLRIKDLIGEGRR